MSVEAFGATKVLIIADDPLARAGLAALLATAPHVAVTGQGGSEADLDVLLSAFLPDVVLWDLGWTPADPLTRLGEFVEAHATPVVALLAVDSLASAVQAAGARGLLTRTSNAGQMAAALDAVVQGLLVFDETLLATPALAPIPNDLIEPLSGRELEVLRHLAEGLSNKEIARALAISENTIKFHVNAILGKLGAQSRTEAVVRATRAGLILL
ncbi:MAG: response regulator transcription factor [Caldilineaceae bacterium]|jgi:DNA-binding NarL/FixJ family response regulator|nr:response regulator transcription factor [Caldilineaceae bacterium]